MKHIILFSLFIFSVWTAPVLAQTDSTATIASDSTGTFLVLATPKAEAFSRITIKALGVDFVSNRVQLVGCYRNAEGKEGDGFTIDLTATEVVAVRTLIPFTDFIGGLMQIIAQRKGLVLQ